MTSPIVRLNPHSILLKCMLWIGASAATILSTSTLYANSFDAGTATVVMCADTTNVAASTCDPAQVGVTSIVLTNQNGCDSLVITTTTLLPSDTTNVAASTCDPAQVGVTSNVLTNQFGCDSVVITTSTLLPNDTTNVAATTCDPAQVGITTQIFTNQFGCDSLVITTSTLLPSDTTNVAAVTCDATQTGTSTQIFSNQFGCDSVVITSVTLLPNDTVNINLLTCEPSEVGTSVVVFTNQFGCDSLIITTIELAPLPDVQIEEPCLVAYPTYLPLSCVDLESSVSGGTAPFTFLWTSLQNPVFSESASSINVCPAITTTYVLEVTDANGCVSRDSATVNVIDPSCPGNGFLVCFPGRQTICVPRDKAALALEMGAELGPCGSNPCTPLPVQPTIFDQQLPGFGNLTSTGRIYPNPASQVATLMYTAEQERICTLSMINLNGQTVYERKLTMASGQNEIRLDLAVLSPGVYFVQVSNSVFQWQQQLIVTAN